MISSICTTPSQIDSLIQMRCHHPSTKAPFFRNQMHYKVKTDIVRKSQKKCQTTIPLTFRISSARSTNHTFLELETIKRTTQLATLSSNKAVSQLIQQALGIKCSNKPIKLHQVSQTRSRSTPELVRTCSMTKSKTKTTQYCSS